MIYAQLEILIGALTVLVQLFVFALLTGSNALHPLLR